MNNRGFILLALLPILLLLGAVGSTIGATLIAALKLQSSRTHYWQHQKDLTGTLLSSELNSPPPASSYLKQAAHPETTSMKREMVVLGAPLPIVNFSRIIGEQLPCSQEHPSHALTFSGYSLTPSSLVAHRTCSDERLEGAYPGNLDMQALEPSSSIVAALGYIDLGQLALTGDLTIVAAGDLHIGEITSSNNYILTLFSSTGVVVVDAVTTTMRFRTASRSGVYLPAGIIPEPIETSAFPVLPRIILGISKNSR